MAESPTQPPTAPGVVHRLLERLTAAKTHVWMLRRHLRRAQVDRAAAEDHLNQIETQLDEATALAANLQGNPQPPP